MGFNGNFLPLEWTALLLLFIVAIIQIFYYIFLYRSFILQNKKCNNNQLEYSDQKLPVSVIVYACNDADNLVKNLPTILEQNYPQYEVIIVNDGSTDETKELLKMLQNQYNYLYQTYIPEEAKNHSRRKLAMTVGLKAAKYDWILTTDANCEISSKNWISKIARNFTPRTEVVLMYSTYRFPKSIKSTFRSLDNLFFSLRYLSMAYWGRPFMGVRRNLAYRKELYFRERGGFSDYLYLRDGDDDLFINRVSNKENTRIELSAETVTKANFYFFDKAWKEQKLSFGITSRYLKKRAAFLFGFESLTRYSFYLLTIFSLSLSHSDWIITSLTVSIFLLRYLTQVIIINGNAKVVGEGFYLTTLIAYDLIQPLIDLRFKILGRTTKNR